ncbi:MAG: citrate synthase, partial [Anaerolineales bacterium]|nr:citrate synthase [Anaerolineales bacterium]
IEIDHPDNVDAWFDARVAARERIMGFGHRVYHTEDPRATILRSLSLQTAERHNNIKWHQIAARLEERVLAHPYFQERGIFTNVDFYTGPLLYVLGLTPDLFTPMFAAGRVAGWTAHMLEQMANNRLIRPRARYTGPRDQAWIDLTDRVE